MTSPAIIHLAECLKRELPGKAAQELMAPSVRPPGLAQFDGSNPRSSGVMILLFPTKYDKSLTDKGLLSERLDASPSAIDSPTLNGLPLDFGLSSRHVGLSTVFILRTDGGPHGGQISLPGGKQEDSDADLTETAMRETFEEIGVDHLMIEVIGKLTPLYVPHSNFIIQPVVGFIGAQPLFIPDKKEVAGVIVAPLKQLFDASNHKTMTMHRSGFDITAPYYDASGHPVWGATAMIISEFERIITSCISE